MIGLGALWAATHPSRLRKDDERITRVDAFMPYGLVAVAGAVAVTAMIRNGALEQFLLWNGLCIVVLLVVRQLLTYLGKFPVDSLKIDRSFVNGLGRSEKGSLVATIMEMGQSLRLEVVAEGIERLEQLTELQRLNCQVGQGYYFARPMAAADMATYLLDPIAAEAA
jgi:EAL domain